MQKINVISIIIAHLRTLRYEGGDHISFFDLLVFFIFPASCGALMLALHYAIPDKVLELSISVFSIFAALLLSVQVALYSVSLRDLETPPDPKKLKAFEIRSQERKKLIRELNDNVSYLIMLSIITVTVALSMFFVDPPRNIGTGIAVTLYVHFFLTILMVVKRASIVFSREYEQ